MCMNLHEQDPIFRLLSIYPFLEMKSNVACLSYLLTGGVWIYNLRQAFHHVFVFQGAQVFVAKMTIMMVPKLEAIVPQINLLIKLEAFRKLLEELGVQNLSDLN